MSGTGVKSTNLPQAASLSEVLGNGPGGTAMMAMDQLGLQLVSSGPVYDAISAVSGGFVLTATWATLITIAGGEEGRGAEVLAPDAGIHSAASDTGYDGADEANAGR